MTSTRTNDRLFFGLKKVGKNEHKSPRIQQTLCRIGTQHYTKLAVYTILGFLPLIS